MSMLYRKRLKNQKAVKTAISLSPRTVEGINRIRTAFHSRYPEASYPTLSYVLEAVLSREMTRLERNPKALEAEVSDFERRYAKPATHQEQVKS